MSKKNNNNVLMRKIQILLLDFHSFSSWSAANNLFSYFCVQPNAVWKHAMLHLLSISTRQVHLFSISCLRQVLFCGIICIQLLYVSPIIGLKEGKSTKTMTFLVVPESLMNVQPFETTKVDWEAQKTGQKRLTGYLLYTVHYSFHLWDIQGTCVIFRV